VWGLFLVFNLYANWFLMFLTDVTGKDVVFPSGSPPEGWQ
jgi:hypothetical protein